MNLSIWKRVLSEKFGLPLGLCILLQGVLMAVFLPIMPIILTEKIGLDKNEITIFFLINTLLGIVVTLATGYLSDGKVARHKLILGGGILASLAYVLIAVATTPVHAYIASVIAVAGGLLFPQLFAVVRSGVVADWDHESQVMGITALRTLFSLGFIIGTALSSWLVSVLDFRVIFVGIGVGFLLLSIFSAFILYRIDLYIAQRGQQTAQADAQSQADGKRNVLISLPMYALIVPLLALIVLRGADGTRGVYLSLVMFQIFHDASVAPLMFGITAAAELVTMGLAGYASSKIGEKTTIALGALTGAVYFVILSFTQSLPLLYFAHVLYAVFVAVLLGVAMAYVQGMLADRAGLGGSLYVAVFNTGSLVGILSPLLTAGYDQKVFVIPAILCVVGAALLMVGDRTAQIRKRLLESMTVQEVAREAVQEESALLPGVAPAIKANGD
ncbi:MAG: MFS transporter [Anaerolineae bacterium]|nr:MFS transporter [Anaerolineae bacterium]